VKYQSLRYALRADKNFKTPLEVLEEVQASWSTTGAEAERILQEANQRVLSESDTNKKLEIMRAAQERADALILASSSNADVKASQLRFPGNTMKYFANDHVQRGWEIYEQVMGAEEIRLEKFTRFDPVKGVIFEREQFQQTVSDKFIKPMRYFLRTWKQLDFSQTVRVNRGDEAETKWEERSLAEAMFGKEMLNIPEFWAEAGYPGTEGKTAEDVEIVENGEIVKVKRIKGVIDARKIDKNRGQLLKQMAKTRLAAELYAHVDFNSTDPRYDFIYYETIIRALEQIPGGIEGDEEDMRSAKLVLDPKKRFFTKNDINWIRKKSNTTQQWLFGKAFVTQSATGFGKGVGDMFSAFFKYAGQDLGLK
jgi:hypothetical protein